MVNPSRIIIVAMTEKHLIGRKGAIPWRIPEELRLFKEITFGHTLIMGRRTFESIGGPLPGRCNIVVSSSLAPQPGIEVCRDLASALQVADRYGKQVFFIGGADIYRSSLPLADFLYVSWIKGDYEGDTFFPPFSEADWQVCSEKDYGSFRHVVYRRRPQVVCRPKT
jgi:dihydrofolate reductase